MFSFLPHAYRQKVRREYQLRIWASVSLMLGCVSLASIALVFPAYLSVKSTEAIAAANYAAAVKAETAAGGTNTDASLLKTRVYMTALQSLSPLDADAIAGALSSAEQGGVSIASVSIGQVNGGLAVSIGGTAATRDELIAFSHALQNVSDFSAVTLPVDDLAQDTDISYTISFSINSKS